MDRGTILFIMATVGFVCWLARQTTIRMWASNPSVSTRIFLAKYAGGVYRPEGAWGVVIALLKLAYWLAFGGFAGYLFWILIHKI